MRKSADLVSNGLISVPDIRINHRGFTIKAKRDFGRYPQQSNGNTYKRGYVVTDGGVLVLPGGVWFTSVIEARVAIDIFIEVRGNPDLFWTRLRELQGLDEYESV